VLVGSAAALLVLLICCANLSNLLLVRAIERRNEFATRLAIGAQRRHLLGVVFAESVLLAVCGGIAGGLLARWMVEVLVRLTPFELPRGGELGHGIQIPLIVAVLILITALVVSALPAWEVAKAKQGPEISRGSRSTSRRFARQLIATFEIAIALTLLAGSGLMARTMLALRDANPGWNTSHLLAAQIYLPKRRYHQPHEVQQVFETFIERLRNTPGVTSVAASSALPTGKTGIDFDLPVQLPGKAGDNAGRASIRAVTPGYFKTMGIPLLQGRAFDDKDRGLELRRIMVNHAFVTRYLPDSPSVVGQQVAIVLGPPSNYEIVGVVGDVYHYGMLREPKPEFYVPFAAMPFSGMGVVVRTLGDPQAFAPTFRKQLWSVDPELPVSTLETMDNMVKDTWSDRSFLTTMMVVFAIMAVALTILGVFSVVSFSVSRQVREIGIRMAMGARRDDVVRLVMGQSARAAVAGVTVGLIGSWLLGRGLASLIYGVSPSDPWVLLGGAVCVGVIAGFGAYLPSRRAAKIDPMAALRLE
jgi:putative ABC transport system permease protein